MVENTPAGRESVTDPVLLRSVAEQLATEAADFVRARRAEVFGDQSAGPNVRAKSTPTDPVTVVDLSLIHI